MGASASLLKDIMSIVKLMRIDAIKKCVVMPKQRQKAVLMVWPRR